MILFLRKKIVKNYFSKQFLKNRLHCILLNFSVIKNADAMC